MQSEFGDFPFCFTHYRQIKRGKTPNDDEKLYKSCHVKRLKASLIWLLFSRKRLIFFLLRLLIKLIVKEN